MVGGLALCLLGTQTVLDDLDERSGPVYDAEESLVEAPISPDPGSEVRSVDVLLRVFHPNIVAGWAHA